MREIYQNLYSKPNYGRASTNSCPGVRYYPLYKSWLESPVLDVGCGSGDTVELLRQEGFVADGIDWIALPNEMLVADICEPQDWSGYKSAICIDVLEHISDEDLEQLYTNLVIIPKIVFNVFSGSHKIKNTELHINIKPQKDWLKVLSKIFDVVSYDTIDAVRTLYFCKAG